MTLAGQMMSHGKHVQHWQPQLKKLKKKKKIRRIPNLNWGFQFKLIIKQLLDNLLVWPIQIVFHYYLEFWISCGIFTHVTFAFDSDFIGSMDTYLSQCLKYPKTLASISNTNSSHKSYTVLLAKHNTLILYLHFHRMFMFLLLMRSANYKNLESQILGLISYIFVPILMTASCLLWSSPVQSAFRTPYFPLNIHTFWYQDFCPQIVYPPFAQLFFY